MMICKGLNESAKLIHEIAKSKGFWDKERNVGELLMLVVSELGEAMEAHRGNKFANIYYMNGATRFLNGEYPMEGRPGIKSFKEHYESCLKGCFEDEIADTVIRLLDLCAGLNIDIEKHIQLKVEYNKTRERLHGKEY